MEQPYLLQLFYRFFPVQQVCQKICDKNNVHELIVKNFIANREEYNWLCDQVNKEYFGYIPMNYSNTSESCGYNYFETSMGKFRLKVIAITKKLHLYEPIKKLLIKIRKN